MKLLGFSIANDCIALRRGTDYFDLHNNFHFQGLTYDPARRSVALHWTRTIGDWIPPTEPAELRVAFAGVYLFKAHERQADAPFSEDHCLDSIGFIWDDLLPEMCGYTSNEPGDGCTHLNAVFLSGLAFKIGAESATLYVSGGP